VNYQYKSADCRGRASARATDIHPHALRGPNKNIRPSLRASSRHRSHSVVKTLPENDGWEAVQEMYLASRPQFVTLAYNILRNKEDAEDAVQDAFISAYRHLRTFEGRSAFKTWFTRIVLNAALMIRRKRKPAWAEFVSQSGNADDRPWTETIPAPQPDPEMLCGETETFQLIDVLLGKMSPILRQAFTMTYYDEMSNEEAGAVLGVTKGTFKTRLLRARRHLLKQTRRSVLAPIRRQTRFSLGTHAFQAIAARAADFSSPEPTFS
jgi:RNA polymerase sigma factor (sigma-70 family)